MLSMLRQMIFCLNSHFWYMLKWNNFLRENNNNNNNNNQKRKLNSWFTSTLFCETCKKILSTESACRFLGSERVKVMAPSPSTGSRRPDHRLHSCLEGWRCLASGRRWSRSRCRRHWRASSRRRNSRGCRRRWTSARWSCLHRERSWTLRWPGACRVDSHWRYAGVRRWPKWSCSCSIKALVDYGAQS